MKTLALDNNTWDLYLDDMGNIAVQDGNNQLQQDVASSVRVWLGECIFNKNRGIPYNTPDENRPSLKHYIKEQALMIKGVDEAVVSFEKVEDRTATVLIYITNENGDKITVGEKE